MTRLLPLLAALTLAAPVGAQAVPPTSAEARVVRLSGPEAAAFLDSLRDAEPLADALGATLTVLAASDELAEAFRDLRSGAAPLLARIDGEGVRVVSAGGDVPDEVAVLVRGAVARIVGADAETFALPPSVDPSAIAQAVREAIRTLEAERVSVAVPAASASVEAAPEAVRLDGVWPNPASGSVAVRYAVPEAGAVRVAVYDALGREVAVAADGPATAGAHAAQLDVSGWAPGLYVVRVTAPGGTATRTFTVVR